jgi:hypothetical protein
MNIKWRRKIEKINSFSTERHKKRNFSLILPFTFENISKNFIKSGDGV